MPEVLRIGVDVGGTNTDAVLLRGRDVLASHKSPTTPDVGSGVVGAITEILKSAEFPASAISAVMIGTTHFTNALVEAQHLCRVGVLRLGAPATLAIRPMADWPARLRDTVHGHTEIIGGGFNYDGRPITPLDPAEVKRAAREFAARGIESVAISSVFAPVNTAQEQEAADILQQELPSALVALSSQIGRIGLIERENAAVMNAALLPMARRVVESFRRALSRPRPARAVLREPERRHAARSGRRRALPGAHLRVGPDQQHARRAPISPARPRRSSWTSAARRPTSARWSTASRANRRSRSTSAACARISACRTCSRSASAAAASSSRRAARCASARAPSATALPSEALVFGGTQLTATDIAVAAGYADVGDRGRVAKLDRKLVAAAVDEIHRLAEDALDRMKTTAAAVPVILVGGGSVLIDRELQGRLSRSPCRNTPASPMPSARRSRKVSGTRGSRVFLRDAGPRQGAASRRARRRSATRSRPARARARGDHRSRGAAAAVPAGSRGARAREGGRRARPADVPHEHAHHARTTSKTSRAAPRSSAPAAAAIRISAR